MEISHNKLVRDNNGGSLDELCDVLEVAHAIAKARGFSEAEISRRRADKNIKNGALKKDCFLKKR